MPERQNSIRVDATAVQGPDAFVRLRRLSWERRQEAQRLLAEAAGGTLPSNPADVTVTTEFLRSNEEYTRQMLRECVLEWNWVDDAGTPLPLPKDVPGEGLGELSETEVAFLIRALQTPAADLKNSGPASPSTSGRAVKRRRNIRS